MRTLLGLCVCCIGVFLSTQVSCSEKIHKRTTITKSSSEKPQLFLQATKKARQGVVSIYVISKPTSDSWERLGGEDLSPVDNKTKNFSKGSGFIISKDGYIVTNNHVVEESESITVQLLQGTEYPAQIIETDPTTDIALIKIDATDLPVLNFADSSRVEVGETVLTIGNPFGLQGSVAAGIVSGDCRSYPGELLIQNFFQTDAAMNPGNSGGPLINLDGDVVGMNSCGISPSGGCIGLGFSIPSNLIKEVLKDLSEHKRPIRGHLDMLLYPVNPSIALELGLEKHQGAFVFAVSPKGPAGIAGFRPGDVILEVQGTLVMELGQARTAIAFAKPGDELSFLVRRGSEQITLQATVGEALPPSAQSIKVEKELGLRLQPTFVNWKNAQDIQTGLLVTEINTDGSAYKAGLRLGQIILEANGREMSSVEDLAEEVFKKTFLSLTVFQVLENDKVLSVDLFQ